MSNIFQSSHLQAHDYDPVDRLLHIQFTNGAVYRYSGVPQTEYDNLRQSASPGSYFHSKIKASYPSSLVIAAPRRKH